MDYSEISPDLDYFRHRFLTTHPQSPLDDMDWRRCNYALKFVVGTSLCEVGPGVGQILNAVDARMGKLSAIDIKRHTMAMFPQRLQFHLKSITDKIDIEPHDTVMCMEVIEHIPSSENEKILANLRKLTGRRLVLTVPFNEPEPLWGHDKPGGHRQRFTLDKLSAMFPSAYGTILPRYGVDWLFLVEDRYKPAEYFQIMSRPDLLQLFNVG